MKQEMAMKIRAWMAFGLVAVATLATAQQANKKTQNAKNVETAKTQQTQFEPKFFAEETPINSYFENDPAKVYEWLLKRIESIPGKPDQFSPPAEKIAYDSALAESLKDVGKIPMIGKCQKHYKSENEAYEVKSLAFSIKNHFRVKEVDAKSKNVKVVDLSTQNLKQDSYIGQNAYGAETKIAKITSDVYSISFPFSESPYSDGAYSSSNIYTPYDVEFKNLTLNFGMASADARVNDKNIVCLFVVSVAPPYLIKFQQHSTPTRSSPIESNFSHYSIYGSIEKVAVINKLTGDVYAQVTK